MHFLCVWVPQSPTASALALNCTWQAIPPTQGTAVCMLLPHELMGLVCSSEAGPRPNGSIANLSLVPGGLCSDSSMVSGPMSRLAPSPQHRGEGGCALGGSGMKWVCPAFALHPTSLLVRAASLGEQVGIWSTHPVHRDTGSHLPREVGMEGDL